jgi:hypothetical protein
MVWPEGAMRGYSTKGQERNEKKGKATASQVEPSRMEESATNYTSVMEVKEQKTGDQR